MILVFIMHFMFATIFPIGRLAFAHVQPIFFTAIRMISAGVVLQIFQYARRLKVQSDEKISFQELILLIFVAIFGVFLTSSLEFWALQFVPAAKTAFFYSLSPFFAAFISYLFYAEKFTLKKYIGMAIGFSGFILMTAHDAPLEVSSSAFSFFSFGELALTVSAMATVIGLTAMRFLVRDYGYTSLEINGVTMIWGGLICILFSLCVESWHPLPVTHYMPFFGYLALSIVCTNLIAFILYGSLVKYYTVTFLTLAGFIEPIVSAILGWFFLGETVMWHFYAASVLVFGGLYIFYRQELLQGYIVGNIKKN